MTTDAIRSQLVALFEQFKPTLQAYYEYGTRAAALSEEYHWARLTEVCPQIEELTLVGTLDARETPATLDRRLAELKDSVTIRKIIFDRATATYHLFT